MLVKIKVNGKLIQDDVQPQTLLLDWLRDHGCYSVKRGCDTANCGLCTVWKDGTPILSCSTLVVMVMRLRRLKDFKKKQVNLVCLWQNKELNNVVSVRQDLL